METDKLIRITKELFDLRFLVYNLCFVYIGMFLAQAYSIQIAVLITIAFVAARSAGILMNRYVGREEDLMNRSKVKTMPSLKVPKRTILMLFFACSAIFLLSAFLLNRLALILAPIPLIVFVIDPMTKRHTSKRHYVIGIIQSFDVIGGYIGASGAFPTSIPVYLLAFAILFIGNGLDILISVRKVKFDAKHKLKTIASTKGIHTALNYSIYSHINGSILLVLFAITTGSSIVIAGSIVASLFMLAQHIGIDPKNGADIVARVVKYNTLSALILFFSVFLSVAVLVIR